MSDVQFQPANTSPSPISSPVSPASDLTASLGVAASSDRFLQRFIDLWLLVGAALWVFQFTTMPAIQYPSLLMLATGLATRFALRAGHIYLARLVFTIPLCIAVMVIPLLINGVRTPLLANMPMLILLVGWILGRRVMVAIAALFAVGIGLLWLVEARQWLVFTVALRTPDVWAMTWVTILTMSAIVAWSLIGNYEADFRHEASLRQQLAEALKRAEAANTNIKNSERRIRAVTDNLPGLVAYWDTDLRCRFANNRFREWFGKTQDDMIGMRIQDLLGEDLFETNEPYMRRALLGEQQSFESRLTMQSGEVRRTRVNYIPDAGEKVTGLFVLVSDVTQLKQAEETQRIAATAFESHEAMMITDANSVILRINQAFTEATGYTSEDLVGQTPRLLKSGRHDAAFYAAMWDAIRRTGSWKGEIWDRRKNGEIYPNWISITGVADIDGSVTHYVCTQSDITVRKEAEQSIHALAYCDPLTALPNRRLLMDRLEHGLAQAKRYRRALAVLFLDIDNFKQINDTLGHSVGDDVLQEIARRIAGCMRAVDTVARPGGDEFIIVLPEIAKPADASLMAEKIIQAVGVPIQLNEQHLDITVSIGIAVVPVDGSDDAHTLLKNADLAMYAVKNSGRNGYKAFEEISSALP